jgi:hypothetical protein
MATVLPIEVALAKHNAGDFNLWGALDPDVILALATNDVRVPQYHQKVIVLCGSTRFKAQWIHLEQLLSKIGHVPIVVEFYHHDHDVQITDEVKKRLDWLHLRKIDMADAIFVVNHNGYVGESTMKEILYAHATGKPIGWLEPQNAITVTVGVSEKCDVYEMKGCEEQLSNTGALS